MTAVVQPNIGIKQGWADQESGWGLDMNAALRTLDMLVQANVKDKDLTAPPGSPADGDAYIVAGSPTGAWAGQAGKIARWRAAVTGVFAAAWEFFAPRAGWQVWVVDESIFYRYSGSAWIAKPDVDTTVVSINNQTGTSYTFALSDAGKVVRQANASAITDTLPTNASVAFPLGSVISIRQTGAGQVTVTPAGGVTLNIPTSFAAKTGRQHATIMLHKVGTDEWDITGDLGT